MRQRQIVMEHVRRLRGDSLVGYDSDADELEETELIHLNAMLDEAWIQHWTDKAFYPPGPNGELYAR